MKEELTLEVKPSEEVKKDDCRICINCECKNSKKFNIDFEEILSEVIEIEE